MILFTDLEQAKAFHGHLGPNLVIGLKMGNYAVSALGSRRYFGMKVNVRCPAGPPVSCVIDGLQLSTGCTMGKANISHTVADGCVEATFTDSDMGESITLRVNNGVMERFGSLAEQIGEEVASRQTWEAADEEIFERCGL